MGTQSTTKTANPTAPQGTTPSAQGPKPLDGYWKLAFSFNDNVQSSHFRLTQNGDKFGGQGTDDSNSKPFLMENGLIRQDEVVFYKRYEQPDNPNQPPVEYSGKLDAKTGYMSGKYLITFQGKEIAGDWEAQKEGVEETAQAPPEKAPVQNPNAPAPGQAPDLSGKWNMGFEYQFSTVQSIMFLEQQLDNTITGHGQDVGSKERFVIEKGWYAYPKLTLIRKYPAVKPKPGAKTGGKPERRMKFKADVTWINEADYSGPYIQGKTEGGGSWEAQRVK